MQSQIERGGGSGLFYLTTFEQLSAETVLTAPVWQLAGSDTPTSIIPRADHTPHGALD
jgi:hypothetical protein